MTVAYHVGDTRDVIGTIPDGSVSLVACSPPFIALRSYLPADHPDKHREIGSEPDPASFIDTLLGLTAEWGRVLAPWGSIAIELGDTYAGSGGAGGDYSDGGLREGQQAFSGSASKRRANGIGDDYRPARSGRSATWPRAKCLALVPQLYATSLAYGRNLLTGQPSPAGQWLVRNVITWHRPNPAVGALGDKVRPSTSQIVVATRSPKRWFDLTAVRTPEPGSNTHARTARGVASRATTGKAADRDGNFDTLDTLHMTAGAPPLDCWFDEHDTDGHEVWKITTQPSPLPHYACVDAATQALTRDGWKYHDDLNDGDEIAAYDAERKVIVWQPATFHRYPFDGELVAIDKRTTSQRLTPNHRVLLEDRRGNHKEIIAEDLRPGHRVPLIAPFNDDRDGGSTAFAELLGWYITEGNQRGEAARIYQSRTVNPEKCERITALLGSLGAQYVQRDRQRRGSLSRHEEWTEAMWTITGPIGRALTRNAPGKQLTPAWVFGTSHAEARALLDGLIGGDGHTRANGRRSFIQQSRETCDMVQALACRLGIRSTIGLNTNAWQVTFGSRTATTLRGADGRHDPIGRERYVGTVWCPSVATTYWLARRNGRPFITGNTWPPKLAERLILMMCPAEVCSQCGEPRRRIEGRSERYAAARAAIGDFNQRDRTTGSVSGSRSVLVKAAGGDITCAENITLGWTDCGHDAFTPGVVLDPFAGTGTTLAVAHLHGRDAIGIDLDSRNQELYPARLAECRRALFGTKPELSGQGSLLDGVTA